MQPEAVRLDDPRHSGRRLLAGIYRGASLFKGWVIRIAVGAAAAESFLHERSADALSTVRAQISHRIKPVVT